MATVFQTPLNEQQIFMLRLLKRPLPEEDFQKVRRLAVQLLGERLDEITSEWEEKSGITVEHYIKLSKGHFRSKAK